MREMKAADSESSSAVRTGGGGKRMLGKRPDRRGLNFDRELIYHSDSILLKYPSNLHSDLYYHIVITPTNVQRSRIPVYKIRLRMEL